MLLVGVEPLDDAPILDLRIRKGVRRNGVKLAIASARPSALDPNAAQLIRHAPGGEAEFLTDLIGALEGSAGASSRELSALATLLRDGGEDVVIVWSERIGSEAAVALGRVAELLGLAGRDGAGLLEIPGGANGRGLREAGVLPDAGPGLAVLEDGAGRDAAGIAQAAADGELTALYLLQTDPIRDQPDRALWERALHSAALVVAHASVLTEGLREHATVIFPAESHAEKEGTVVHPDGRLQRLRIAIAHPDEVRPGWSVLAELASRAGVEVEARRSADVFDDLVAAVPFYAGLTLEEIGGRGVRWPEREAAAAAAPEREDTARRAELPALGARSAGRRRAAPRDLPADLGRPRGRDLARASLPDPGPAARALPVRRRVAGNRSRRRGRPWRRTVRG